jgi:putative transposase
MVSVGYRDLVGACHCVGGSNYHFVFVPKYRRKVFRDSLVQKTIERAFHEIAGRLGLWVHALEFGSDHCHLFLGGCRDYSVSELAHRFKGASSHRVRQECLDRIVRQGLYGKAFWSAGYFYESIGRVTSETIQHYIERKQRKHWRAIEQEEGQVSLDKYT